MNAHHFVHLFPSDRAYCGAAAGHLSHVQDVAWVTCPMCIANVQLLEKSGATPYAAPKLSASDVCSLLAIRHKLTDRPELQRKIVDAAKTIPECVDCHVWPEPTVLNPANEGMCADCKAKSRRTLRAPQEQHA
jgi:hypothetical protein